MKELFSVLEQHKKLRVFEIEEFSYTLDCRHQCLGTLIQQNSVIQMTSSDGELVTNSNDMHLIHSFNRFYCGLNNLGQETQAIRPALVAKTLIHSAARDFQRSALLLARQTDSLCEFVQAAIVDNGALESIPTQDKSADRTIPVAVSDLPGENTGEMKRKSTCQVQPAAKKTR